MSALNPLTEQFFVSQCNQHDFDFNLLKCKADPAQFTFNPAGIRCFLSEWAHHEYIAVQTEIIECGIHGDPVPQVAAQSFIFGGIPVCRV
ncbi:hypothetical protein D3C80_1920000 [compost metagenome]